MKINGNLVDIHSRDIYPAEISLEGERIKEIRRVKAARDVFILPGLIDAHIHIESSMITPGAFAQAAVINGTTAVVADPHEIANVLGERGVNYMINDSKRVPVRFYFGAPSCVPATEFETNGAILNHVSVAKLLKRREIKYLSEMMNFPGVINEDIEVIKKINAAKNVGKPVDGHAPGLTGEMLSKYVMAGISTDHECTDIEEAKEKLGKGMKILLREGSAARNLNALKNLFYSYPEKLMLCSDDMHPEMLQERHINKVVAALIEEGFDLYDIIRSATKNPAEHYSLDAGLMRTGDYADFIMVDAPRRMNVIETWIAGRKVFDNGKVLFKYKPGRAINAFNCNILNESEIKVRNEARELRVIQATDGELLTTEIRRKAGLSDFIETDLHDDLLKIVVKDRYFDNPPALGFITGFGLKKGAFASSVAHDSHNIIAVGTNDSDIIWAINEVIRLKGGLAVASAGSVESLQLNIGGIMTTRSCREVSQDYMRLDGLVKSLGCTMSSPFMALSFMALLVIPDLKIGDKGLFDVKKFRLVSLFL